MTFSVDYRRVHSKRAKLVNSREESCGPRFTFVVNGEVQFISTQAAFLSQGRFSVAGNASLPIAEPVNIEFRTIANGCKHSKLLVFNEAALVDTRDEKLLDRISVDPADPSKFSSKVNF
jgi:hypothetical protein